MMSAQTLNCPMCGAAAASAATHCPYCDSRLATIACPSCFGMMFLGSKHCPHCGAKGARAKADAAADAVSTRRCPRCRVPLEQVALGATMLLECQRCDGLWVDAAAFEQICADREQQSAVLGAASHVPAQAVVENVGGGNVRYVPCPECGQLMNRLNFARCSGVIIDMCKGHGTWFDREELRQIVEFIRAGGLEASRTREKEQLAEERRRLQQDQFAADARVDLMTGITEREHRRASLRFVAKDLLGLLID